MCLEGVLTEKLSFQLLLERSRTLCRCLIESPVPMLRKG